VNNDNSGNPLIFLAFIVLTVIAVFGGRPAKWKLYNLVIILGACAFGIGLGALPLAFGGNSEISAHLAAAFLFPVHLFEDAKFEAFNARIPIGIEKKLLLLVVVLRFVIVIDRPVRLGQIRLERFLHVGDIHALALGEAVND
jgi:hypothetical protein